jgi:hypothetical protein
VRATIAAGRWTLDLSTNRYAVGALARWLGTLVDVTGSEAPAGTMAVEAHAAGSGPAVESLNVRATLTALTLSAFQERLAAQGLDGTLELDAKRQREGHFATQIALRASAGQAYADPWFVDAAAHPFSFRGAGISSPLCNASRSSAWMSTSRACSWGRGARCSSQAPCARSCSTSTRRECRAPTTSTCNRC